jgi:hypothetical protein
MCKCASYNWQIGQDTVRSNRRKGNILKVNGLEFRIVSINKTMGRFVVYIRKP